MNDQDWFLWREVDVLDGAIHRQLTRLGAPEHDDPAEPDTATMLTMVLTSTVRPPCR